MTYQIRPFLTVLVALSANIVLALRAAPSIPLTPQESSFLSSIADIKLCVGPDSMPLDDIVDGVHTGINAEYMKLFQVSLDKPIRLIETSEWNQSMEYVSQGKCDIISLVAKTPQREEYLLFTEPYVTIPFVVVTTQDKFFVSRLSDLVGEKLAVHKGYAYVDLLRNRFPSIQLLEVPSLQDGLKKVDSGEIFGYLSGLHIAGYAIQTGSYSNLKINGQFDEFANIELGIGIRKEMQPLLSILNKAINAVDPEIKKRIDSSWLTVRYDISEDYSRILQLSIATVIVILFLVYRQYQLRRHNFLMAEREQEIWRQANYDFLTGLPNRRLFQDRLTQKLTETIRNHVAFAVVLIDLDEFKEVNDTLGHDQGDQLLQEASNRIKECLRQSDTIARLGGDEFVVILNDIHDARNIEKVASDILEKLSAPFKLKETAFISASIGITLCPKDADNIVELLKNADQAMYAAKADGRNKFHYFTARMQQEALLRRSLINELRLAIETQQFELYYQPIIDLQTGIVEKAEALIRWNHPDKGIIGPDTFIPILEETRMIIQVGEWVFKEAARQAKRLCAMYHPPLQISVNASPLQFYSNSTTHWNSLIQEIGAAPLSIAIEITESMLMQSENNITSHLLELRDNGFQVSMDDFGTGYSSLSYLRKFDIDYLKIDKSFVKNLYRDSDDMVLCEAIIIMAHKLGLKVIAEGVESENQQFLLADALCDYGQGFHIAKPLPLSEFEKMLTSQAVSLKQINDAIDRQGL